MKKLLLSGAAAAALAFASTPAMASSDGVIDLEVGGFFKAYGVFADHDDDFGGVGVGADRRSFDLRRSGLISFSGESTLDNGLTVGAVIEMETEGGTNNANLFDDNDTMFEESYIYFSGGWGRFNFGNEDGAGYLLQVAAPSANDNIDGVRQDISSFNYIDPTATTPVLGAAGSQVAFRLDYDMDMGWGDEKLTYLTPKFNGFQAGVSYAPEVFAADGVNSAVSGMDLDNEAGDYEHGLEIAARWDGEFEDVAIALGAGYAHASEENGTPGTTDDWQQWNAAFDLGFQAFGLGAAYHETNNGLATNGDTTTWVVGVDWENGPYTLGLSYLDREDEATAAGIAGFGGETDHTRITGGGSYAYGPGMSFRGSVSWVNQDDTVVDEDAYQVAIGTDISF